MTYRLACSSKINKNNIDEKKQTQKSRAQALGILVFVTSCVTPPSQENANNKPVPGSPIELPTAHTTKPIQTAAEKLLEQIPGENQNTDSDLDVPAEGELALPEKHQSFIPETKLREHQARRTDQEIIGNEEKAAQKRETEIGKLDRELGVENADKQKSNPSFILGIKQIKLLFKKRQYEDALIETNNLLQSYPQQTQLLLMKGTLHLHMRQLDLALASFVRAYEIEPSKKLKAQIHFIKKQIAERSELAAEHLQEKAENTSNTGGMP